MKKFSIFFFSLLISVAAFSKSVSLSPGVWDTDGAKFAVWHWQGSNEGTWSAFMTLSGDVYTTSIDDNSDHIIFVRINSTAAAPGWADDVKWNQTDDLDYQNCTYIITDWGSLGGSSLGEWSTDCGVVTPTGYYLTGDGDWTGGAAWDPKAALLEDGKITIANLPAGTYAFKITNGSWNQNWGFESVDASCSNITVTGSDDGNVVFTTSSVGDVTIAFNGSVICVSTTADVVVPDPLKEFSTPTPSNCGDVMFQAFYYDSNEDKGYGNTQWATLLKSIGEIGAYFDMVWLPPSGASTGGTGYHPTQFCNQNGSFGSETELKQIIEILHDNNTKVIADVVLNHRWNRSTWCDFWPEDFGRFGAWQLTASHICSDDEMYTYKASEAGACAKTKPKGAKDTGEKYDAARDLDHTATYVQNFSIAYLKWLLNVMDYDGFRYDVAKGFGAQYFGQYNAASKPYFSVGEYFDGDYDKLKAWTDGTGKRSTAFDFAFKYNAVGKAWTDGGSPNYSALIYNGQPAGFVGAEYRQYSVTFIDNHDTFERSDNKDSEFLGYKKSMTSANKNNVLQANAYMLSMPGVPCVFYPHYYKYKSEIQAMIRARKSAGVHNMSNVTVNEVSSGKLIATVQGTKGKLMLKLGSDTSTPSGYKVVAQGSGYAMFVESSVSIVDPKPVATLNISPAGGKYLEAQKVSIVCTDATAKIYYTLDGSEPTTDSQLYTSAITISQNTVLKVFAVTSTSKTKVYTHEYRFVDKNTPITVKCYKPASWAKVNIWAWNASGDLIKGTWPGVAINDDGDGWWSYTFDIATVRPVNVIFNDGGSPAVQTQNLEGIMESTCFDINVAGMGVESPDCVPLAVGEEEVRLFSIYPNPVSDYLTIDTDEQLKTVYVYDITGRQQAQFTGDNKHLNVSALTAGMYVVSIQTANGKQATELIVKQ